MLLLAILTLTTAILSPLVALATIALLPFSNRPTQYVMFLTWTMYVALVGVVILQ